MPNHENYRYMKLLDLEMKRIEQTLEDIYLTEGLETNHRLNDEIFKKTNRIY